MTARNYTTTVSICIDDTVSEVAAEISYEYHKATRGYREAGVQMEPDFSAYCELESVVVTLRRQAVGGAIKTAEIDLLPMLSADAVIELEAAALRHEREQAEEARTERRISELEVA